MCVAWAWGSMQIINLQRTLRMCDAHSCQQCASDGPQGPTHMSDMRRISSGSDAYGSYLVLVSGCFASHSGSHATQIMFLYHFRFSATYLGGRKSSFFY